MKRIPGKKNGTSQRIPNLDNFKHGSQIETFAGLVLTLLLVLANASSASAATYTVVNNSDSGAGSLRQAILEANGSVDNDTIVFDSSLAGQTITLTSGEIQILGGNGSLTINGLGADRLRISGNNQSRVFFIQVNTTVAINGITVTGGNGVGVFPDMGGGIANSGNLTLSNLIVSGNSTAQGGGIYNNGTMTLTNGTITGNAANLNERYGGGIFNSGNFTLSNSTVRGNVASCGAGFFNDFGKTAIVNSSTLNNNSADSCGGGIFNGGNLTAINSTLSGNTASLGGGIFAVDSTPTTTLINLTLSGNSASDGGGIHNRNILTVKNTIIANSLSGGDCSTQNPITVDHSLVKDGSCDVQNGVNGNKTGDPYLCPLADNGGLTKTFALWITSPAINAGNNALIPAEMMTDQRGGNRIVNNIVDIGAIESRPPSADFVSVSGRILTTKGYGIAQAIVSLTMPDGEIRIARSNPFGYYNFDNIPVNQIYNPIVKQKQFMFSPPPLHVLDTVRNFDFVASANP